MDVKRITDGVYRVNGKIATENLYPGKKVYGEKTKTIDGTEYRLWNPYRSKPAAAFLKGLTDFPIKKDSKVLYLGVGEGTTASHFSDIVKADGLITGVDIAEKAFEKFIRLCENRKNLIPVLEDANNPDKFSGYVPGKVDVIYQDLAQRGQADILIKNINRFLKDDGWFVYMVKSRSIDVTKDPKRVFKEEIKKIKSAGLNIVKDMYLDPFEKDHTMIMGKKSIA